MFYLNIERGTLLEGKRDVEFGGGGEEDVKIKNIFETTKIE